MFYIKARKKSVVGEIHYHDGRLSGDLMLVELLKFELEANRDNDVGPIMYCPPCGDHAKDPVSIRLIMEDLFDHVEFFGDVPEWPQLEDGSKG